MPQCTPTQHNKKEFEKKKKKKEIHLLVSELQNALVCSTVQRIKNSEIEAVCPDNF
jgi:hypothetical protein